MIKKYFLEKAGSFTIIYKDYAYNDGLTFQQEIHIVTSDSKLEKEISNLNKNNFIETKLKPLSLI